MILESIFYNISRPAVIYYFMITESQRRRSISNQSTISQLTKAIELNPYEISFYLTRGLKYLENRKYDKAIDDFTIAAKLDNKEKLTFLNRGLAYKAQGLYL